MSNGSEQQAKDLIAQAQKKLKSWSLFGPSNKYEDAAEIYEKAGNMYKLAQQWSLAGDAFTEAAKLYKKGNSAKFDGSRAYENAAKCYKRNQPADAVFALKEAILLDQEGGNFRAAARHYQEAAELCENDLNDSKEAYESYQKAAELFLADDSPALANKCLLKVAQIAAEMDMYDVAIDKFEQVAAASVDDALLKWSLKEYFLKAGLCHLCTGDIIRTKQAVNGYCAMDMSFETTREYNLLKNIINCVDNGEVEQFTQCVYEYDKLTRLDSWKTALLLKIKKSIEMEDLR
ncbi:soluble NSF attachment protein [Radiomyces spectabilis]|uniref:soluble NSF attachment protein n=1 Tax=Radiomyces spectabilis TaxID=64574 RepID=UPI0022205CF8|nr:soluble NSF attachment protein [Radiomyces spectabilis]KAI8366075.1 soluble NSF attachment protein [Radiomyces spectabilis]